MWISSNPTNCPQASFFVRGGSTYIDLSKRAIILEMWENGPRSDARQSAPGREGPAEESIEKKRRCERASHLFWAPGWRANPPSRRPPLHTALVTLEQTQRTETVSKRLRNLLRLLSAAWTQQARPPRWADFFMPCEFSLKQPACLQISELVPYCQDSGEGVKFMLKDQELNHPTDTALSRYFKQKQPTDSKFLNYCFAETTPESPGYIVSNCQQGGTAALNFLKEMWLCSHPQEE